MQTGQQYGMVTMDSSLASLVRSGDITLDVAKSKSSNPTELARLLK
jgi:twitching motility protein PilT